MLDARNISVRYGDRQLLRDVSIRVDAGETLALLGPNGAGKTTLLRTLNGTVACGGTVLLAGRPVGELSRREIAQKVAVVAQENETKFPITVMDFVLAGRFARGPVFGWETESDIEMTRRALDLCDLGEFSDRLMNELSGGERQRVVLARALAAETKVLLLDEPTANLDIAHQAMMFRLVRRRCLEEGAAAILITHDLNIASEFADRVALLDRGKLVAVGPPAGVLTAENLRDVFGVETVLDRNPSSGKTRVTMVFR